MSIFQKSVLKNVSQNESVVALRWAEYQKYLEKIDYIKTVKEEKYQDGFLKDIFENCLGYTLDSTNPNDFNLEREKKNETDSKKADGVIYVDNTVIGVIELKAQDTKNLNKIEDQAFNYHASHSNSKYIIISNFDELRFYIDKKTAYEKFSLFNLDYEEFKKLHLLLSYESIKADTPLKLKEKSATFEQDISKNLYKDFSLFRTHLFENIVKNNDLDKALLLRLTQKLCDRIIFILFAEDRGLLTANTIKEIRERHKNDGFGDRSMYDYYKLYFNAINEGNERLNIPKYNGGLFSTDETLDSLVIDDEYLDMEAQKLSDYDFMSDVSVNILGHIFEQSLTDLEEINASINETEFDKSKTKRKKDGVFYTPEYITKYIVDNTLGKLCNDKKEELNLSEITAPKNPKKPTKKEQLQKDNLEQYRSWLLNLKILDPACGSGAFLNQALEFLINEHNALQKDLVVMGDITAYYEVEKSILEHNLYGVDINEDAVEIAKLSLWLRTATKGRELTKLANKIKCGNSLIDDKSVVDNAFVWEEEFPEVFENGGFDVVIGNPPYIGEKGRKDIFRPLQKVFKDRYESNSDIFYFFFLKSIDILKQNGNFGFITTNYFLTADGAIKLRTELKERTSIYNIINFNEMKLFESALGQHNIITMFKKTNKVLNTDIVNVVSSKNITYDHLFENNENVEVFNIKSNDLYDGDKNYIRVSKQGNSLENVFQKMVEKSKFIKDICLIGVGFKTGTDRIVQKDIDKVYVIKPDNINIKDGVFILSEEEYKRINPEKELVKKCYKSSDIDKFSSDSWKNIYVIWTNKNTQIENYPNVKKHLEKYKEILDFKMKDREEILPWWSNYRARDYDVFTNKDKIVFPYRSKSNIFSYSKSDFFASGDVLYLRQKDKNFNIKYLLALLNSKLYYTWLYYKGKRKGEVLELYATPISQIPIKNISEEEQQYFITLVDNILNSKEKITKYKKHFDSLSAVDKIEITEEIEKEENIINKAIDDIDAMVYQLYNLTENEIKIVEGE